MAFGCIMGASFTPNKELRNHMVRIRGMTEEEVQAFLDRNIPAYAADKVQAGNWTSEEAEQRAREEYSRLLPAGLNSAHQHLYTIELDEEPAGDLWLSSDPYMAGGAGFVYDLYVVEEFRRRGIATQALRLLEAEAACLGLSGLSLHVFGDNLAARALYEKLGYEITNLNMAKSLN
jgi:ribosomal protein S18 acetylase RimI-like enzyme